MLRINDREYHERRARDELARAEEASDPSVAAAHRELAALHRRRTIEIVDDGDEKDARTSLSASLRRAN